MQKLAIDQIKTLFWLVKTLKKKDMTRRELNQVWLECEVSGGVDLNYQKLRRLRKQVDELFGIIIECNNKNRYHMVNLTPIKYREFMECYKIVALGDVKPVTIEIEVYGSLAKCFREFPHHESQREIYTDKDYSRFRLFMRPTNYFCGELLMAGDKVRVIKPKWLAELFMHIHEKSVYLYKKR